MINVVYRLRDKWLCFFQLRVSGGRFLSYRSKFAGAYPTLRAPVLARGPLRPSSTGMWFKREYATEAEAQTRLEKAVREFLACGFVERTAEQVKEDVQGVRLANKPKKKKMPKKGSAALARPTSVALRRWEAYFNALVPAWQRALERSIAGAKPPQSGRAAQRRFFEKLSRIEHLIVHDEVGGDLGPVAALKTLKQIDLYEIPVRSLAPLAGLAKLERLDLYGTGVTDLKPLAGLKKLQNLRVANNADLVDLRPLHKLPALSSLDISDTGAEDNPRALRKLDLSDLVVSQQSELGEDTDKWSEILGCTVSTAS